MSAVKIRDDLKQYTPFVARKVITNNFNLGHHLILLYISCKERESLELTSLPNYLKIFNLEETILLKDMCLM